MKLTVKEVLAKLKAAAPKLDGHAKTSVQQLIDAVETDNLLSSPALRLVEQYSDSASDAASGVAVLQSMLWCIADEVDEPDELALMMQAYDLWSQWVTMEKNEIGTAADAGDMDGMMMADSAKPVPITEDLIPLVEKAVRSDGTAPIKLISPGWGSSGYYSPEVIKRDGPSAFPKGTKMYWDHPTLTEEAERPERSLTSLAAVIASTPVYMEQGIAGPGLYGDSKVFEGYRSPVNEMAPYIGTSIRTNGIGSRGKVEGKEGVIVERILPATPATSVDFVTAPGAGGQILQLFEAARQPQVPVSQENNVDEKELQALQESHRTALAEANRQRDEEHAENLRLQEAIILREASDIVTEEVSKVQDMPDITKTRLIETLAKNPPTKEGKLDRETFVTQVTEGIKREAAYIATLTGSGRVRDMGSTDPGALSSKDAEKQLEEAFTGLGLDSKLAHQAAIGRSN